ncbi:hypothetical protein Patl1_18264 [Pistacia atlantica]|uniref:Uncharacterized protein n=1 Tax=Pistacia atlantica TaxID=434234 RepID=A0ACC1BXS2_9ROSI|nr:hypothetical protein Patl1_18264 [Pistacia atlantica]
MLGYRNSKVRKQLVHKWQNDKELDIQNNHIDKKNAIMVYRTKFYRSKFCICPRGSLVNSVCIADSIPLWMCPCKHLIILSDNYDMSLGLTIRIERMKTKTATHNLCLKRHRCGLQ